MTSKKQIYGKDINIKKLVPLNTREINFVKNRGYQRILSTIRMIGLIEPLDVYAENGQYIILNGFLRYKALEELNISTVPCIIHPNKEAYTFNKMINSLSPVQESRMLKNALKTLDHGTMAQVFGVKSLHYRLNTGVINHLHPQIIDAIDKGMLSRKIARELTYVTKERQNQILSEMTKSEDYSLSFVRALIIKTPSHLRNKDKKKRTPWLEDPDKKQELVDRLDNISKRYDFYSNLYRQYSADLLKLYVYARKLITNEKVRLYLEINHPEIYGQLENIIFETNGAIS